MITNDINCEICHITTNQKRSADENKALAVVLVTITTMVAEITFGIITGSMALLADGIHMGTHALALGITAVSYYLARRFATNSGFSFGTGKIGILAGYTNAILLAASAFFMMYESIERLLHPQDIDFTTAMIVTATGLAINIICAFILGHDDEHHHHHHHEHHHHHDHHNEEDHEHEHEHHKDANMRGALLHVIADAMTSVLAIAALFIGQATGFTKLDPVCGILGAILILRWAAGLLKDTACVLVDYGDFSQELQQVKDYFSAHNEVIKDLHLWQFGDNAYSLLVAVESTRNRQDILNDLKKIRQFDHLIVEMR